MTKTILLGIFSIMILSAGQTMLKYGLTEVGGLSFLSEPLVTNLSKLFSTPFIILGFVLYGISAVLWLDVLSKLDFSFAFPLVSLTFVFTLFIGRFVFNEHITAPRVLGVGLIIAGLFFIVRSR